MVYAFDFDGVADTEKMQRFIIKLKRERNEVWIITKRREDKFNKDYMAPVLKKIFVSEANIIFSNNKSKIELIKAINADVYIDNISEELNDINNYTDSVSLLYCKS